MECFGGLCKRVEYFSKTILKLDYGVERIKLGVGKIGFKLIRSDFVLIEFEKKGHLNSS